MAGPGHIGRLWPHLAVFSMLCVVCAAGPILILNHVWSEPPTLEAPEFISARPFNLADTALTRLIRKLLTENPNEIMAGLLLIPLGSDFVQKAILQMAGFSRLTPVLFSFGSLTSAVLSMAGGQPDPDHEVTVVPVVPGTAPIQNQSFLLGRLVRDLERRAEKELRSEVSCGYGNGLLVSAYEIDPAPRSRYGPLKPRKDLLWWSFIPFLVVQLAVAALPVLLSRNWSILLITASGTALALVGASLPRIRRNKYACRQGSNTPYVLAGAGPDSRHAFLILPDTLPRRYDDVDGPGDSSSLPHLEHLALGHDTKSQTSSSRFYLPAVLCLLWMVLLNFVIDLQQDAWYLIAVGALGMAHSVLVASAARHPESHGLPLKKTRGPVFQFGLQPSQVGGVPSSGPHDILLQLEKEYPGAGRAMLPLYDGLGDIGEKGPDWESDEVSASSLQMRRREWEGSFYHTGIVEKLLEMEEVPET